MQPQSGERFDAIVIGAGPAGSTAARRLALRGRSVLLLERCTLPRPKACGGGLTGHVKNTLDFDLGDTVERRVTRLVYAFQGKRAVTCDLEGFTLEMVHRDRFDHLLVKKAVEAGAQLLEGTRVGRLTLHNGTKRVETAGGVFDADVVIGADGATSLTAKAIGLRSRAQAGIAMDADLTVSNDLFQAWKQSMVMDFGVVPNGYGWCFPKDHTFSVGIETSRRYFPSIRAHLEALIQRHPYLSHPRSMTVRAALLPFWTHAEPLAREGVFLVGDAAGLVDPLTGEGISQAIRSGVAAAAFADSRLSGDPCADTGYSEEIERTIVQGFGIAQRLAAAFFRHPGLSYEFMVRSPRIRRLFTRLLAGYSDYLELDAALSASWLAQGFRILKMKR